MHIAGGDSTEAVVATEALGEELVGRLHGAGGFRVLPWLTSGRPLAPDTSLVKVAEGMRATELLTGTITSSDEDTRVHVALVDGRSGLEKWSRDLSAPAGDFAALQGHIALGVAEGMSGRSSDALRARIAADAPRNPEAYAYFIRGASAWHSDDPKRKQTARSFFEQAVAMDSTLAAAWVALGATHVDAHAYGAEGDTAVRFAQRCFERALRIQPGLPVAERGLISFIFEAGSGEDLCSRMLEIAARALQRDPNDVDQLTTAVFGFTMGSQPELALPVIEHTLRLDPGNQSVSYCLVLALGGRFMPMRCIAAGADYTRRFGEDVEVLSGMGAAATYVGRNREAITYLERAVQLVGDDRWYPCKTMLMHAYAAAGDTARAEAARRRFSEEVHRKVAADSTLEELGIGLYVTSGNSREGRQRLERLAKQYGMDPSDTTESHELNLGGREEALAISYAQDGRMDEARRLLRRVSPGNEGVWLTGRPGGVVDSLGTKWDTDDPAILALWHTPEAIALHAGQEAHMVALFNRYQRVVAAALPHEPDVPEPKTKWWRRGPH
jgi:tetratricopeptide (TPR) repeat protein